MAIHIPKTGALSRKERDELKAFGQERGLRVFDDAKRLERDFPEAMAKVRERTGAGEERSADPAAAGAASRRGIGRKRPCYQACGQLRLFAAQKYNDRHKLLDPKRFPSSCGWSISRCSNGTRKRSAGTRRIIRSPRCTTRISKS